MNILKESMTRFTVHRFTIRIWREEPTPYEQVNNLDLFQAIACLTPEITEEKAARAILIVPRVNAVEVLNEDGNGVVLYRDWP